MNFNFNLADLFRAPIKIFVGLAIASGIVLFSPNIIIEKLYMVNFREKYGFIISIVFLSSLSIVLVGITTTIWNKSRKKRLTKKAINKAKANLISLDDYKAAIVYNLFLEDNHTDILPLNDGAVRWLEQLMIIGKASNQYPVIDLQNPEFPYMLQPWVVSELNSNYELKEKLKEAYCRIKRKYN